MSSPELNTPSADMLPGMDDLHLRLVQHVDEVRSAERRDNQFMASVPSIEILQDCAWETYVEGVIHPRQAIWGKLLDTLSDDGISRLDIKRNDEAVTFLKRDKVGYRNVVAHWQYKKHELIDTDTVSVTTNIVVRPSEDAASQLPFQAAAIYLSTDKPYLKRWAQSRLDQFGVSREFLRRRQPRIDYMKLALGAYILENADIVSINQSAKVVGSERDKGRSLCTVELNRADIDEQARPYYLQNEHANEVTEAVASTKSALTTLTGESKSGSYEDSSAEEAISLDDYLEFLRRESGQPGKHHRMYGLHGVHDRSREDISLGVGLSRGHVYQIAWDSGMESVAKTNADYARIMPVIQYMTQSNLVKYE